MGSERVGGHQIPVEGAADRMHGIREDERSCGDTMKGQLSDGPTRIIHT